MFLNISKLYSRALTPQCHSPQRQQTKEPWVSFPDQSLRHNSRRISLGVTFLATPPLAMEGLAPPGHMAENRSVRETGHSQKNWTGRTCTRNLLLISKPWGFYRVLVCMCIYLSWVNFRAEFLRENGHKIPKKTLIQSLCHHPGPSLYS